MSKKIKITQEMIDSMINEFKTSLSNMKMCNGEVKFSKTFSDTKKKATLYFTETAWIKMQTLVREFDKEVAWHGLARRSDGEEFAYEIYDIMVYPQVVTAATVTTDQQEYQNWMMKQPDEVFNNIRMQGHSHVNMGVTPSGVDSTLYESILSQLDDTMFYIFMVWNKRSERTIKIYDMAQNTMFETNDVTVRIVDDGTGIESWLNGAIEAVKEEKIVPKTSTASKVEAATAAGYNSYQSYYGGSSTKYTGQKTSKYMSSWDDDEDDDYYKNWAFPR